MFFIFWVLSTLISGAFANPPQGVHWGALPFAVVTSDQGFEFGALAQRLDYGEVAREPFDNVLTVQASYATRGPRSARLSFEKTQLSRWNLRSSSALLAAQNDHQRYYGLGSSSTRDLQLENDGYYYYKAKYLSFENDLRKEVLISGLDLRAGWIASVASLGPERAHSQYVKDFGSETQHLFYNQLHIGAVLERRNSEFSSSHGYYGATRYSIAPGFVGNIPTWSRFDIEYRRYDPFLEERYLWLATQVRFTSTSDSAPLTEKARLGSFGTLRGLPLNRYIGNDSLSLRTELRSMWFRAHVFGFPLKFGTGLFGDLGKISSSFSSLRTEALHPAWGFSVFGSYFHDDFLGSADVGFSEGGSSYYFRLGHAF